MQKSNRNTRFLLKYKIKFKVKEKTRLYKSIMVFLLKKGRQL